MEREKAPMKNLNQDFKDRKRETDIETRPNLVDLNKLRILYYACIQHNFYPSDNLVGSTLDTKV